MSYAPISFSQESLSTCLLMSCSIQGQAVLQRLAAPTLFSFTAIMFREVLMDVADVEGEWPKSFFITISQLLSKLL
jgi:hypothetical protein